MTFLLLGQDAHAKEAKISELKKKYFKDEDALKFDLDVLYGAKLSAEELKKSIVSLPAIAKERLIILKECHRLNPSCQELILEAMKVQGTFNLILDSEKSDLKESAFLGKIGRSATVINVSKGKPITVFRLGDLIAQGKNADSLKTLSQLLSNGDQPLQIMGGLVWYWKNAREALSDQKFKKGLLALQEADFNIKRSRLKPEQALELLVVKLCS